MLNVQLVCSILTLNSGNEGYLAYDCYGMMIMKGNIKKMNSKSANSDFWLKHDFKVYDIHHFHIDHNVPCLPPKTLHNHCLRIPLGRLSYPGEWLCKILGVNKEHYGLCESRELHYGHIITIVICY